MKRNKLIFAATLAFASAATFTAFGESSAHAMDAEVTSDTAAQFYDVRNPTGETVLQRRRLTTTLGASVYDLIDTNSDPNAPTLTFRSRLRYDADFGASPQETQAGNAGRLVPGFSTGAVDLMYGYVEGRKFLHGWLSFKLGRQYTTDALGWWSFDGASVKITTPAFLAVEAFGGLEQRGGMPLSSSRFEADGITRGDRNGYDPSLWPSYQPADLAPAFGASVETAGLTFIHAKLIYRRVENEGSSNVSEFANGLYSPAVYDGARISSERIGLSADSEIPQIGGIKAGMNYSLYNAEMANAYASIDAYAGKRVTLSVDYDYFQPTFDADSIWNFFQSAPMNDIGARASIQPFDRLSIAGGGHMRIFQQQTAQDAPNTSANITATTPDPNSYPLHAQSYDGGGNLAAKYKFHTGNFGFRGHGNFGPEGDSVGGDIFGENLFYSRFITEARTGVWQWNDKLRPDRDATSFGYTLGAGYKLAQKSKVLLEFDHNVNRLVGQRFRAMIWLTVAVAK